MRFAIDSDFRMILVETLLHEMGITHIHSISPTHSAQHPHHNHNRVFSFSNQIECLYRCLCVSQVFVSFVCFSATYRFGLWFSSVISEYNTERSVGHSRTRYVSFPSFPFHSLRPPSHPHPTSVITALPLFNPT
jgi:hypothetical protein